jgi:hypothetical protein
MKVERLTGNTVRITGPRGVAVSRATGAAVMGCYQGFIDAQFFEPIAALCDEALRERGQITLIADGESLDKYESGFREKWTRWFLDHKKQLVALHFLQRSVFVKMGLNVISLMVNGLVRPYSSRAAFEAALGDHLEAFQAVRALLKVESRL